MSNSHEGKTLYGQQYDPSDDLTVPFTETMQNFNGTEGVDQLGDPRTEIIPEDAQSSKVRVWEPPTAALEAFALSFPGAVDLDLPAVLGSISVTYNTAEGIGNHAEDGDGVSIGTSAALSLSLNSKAQGSASIVPDIQPNIFQKWARNVPCMFYLFYMDGSHNMDDILTRLAAITETTVNAWPKFETAVHTFTLKGVNVTASADANVQQHLSSGSSATYTWGEGEGVSYELSTTTRTVVLPPTIHGVITLINTEQSADVDVSATTGWDAGTNWPARSAAASVEGSVTASVTPTSLSATPVAAIPSSGLYLHRISSERYKWGQVRVLAQVIDFADV